MLMDDATLLDNFFNGLLSPEETLALQQRLATDPDLREAFSLRQKMERFPQQEAVRAQFLKQLQNIENQYFTEEITTEKPTLRVVQNNTRRWLALAASLTLIATAIWFFTRTPYPTYEQFAQHSPLSLTVMGATQADKTDAETAFRQRNYGQALSALERVLAAEPDNSKALFYKGICLLELRRNPEARAVFGPLAAGNSALREDAQWYLALSFLQENNMEACDKALRNIAPGQTHYEQAQQILGR